MLHIVSIQTEAPIDRSRLATLRSEFKGELFEPTDAGYAEAVRLWNGMIERRPALVARVADERDTQVALRFGNELGLAIAIRGGGHNVSGSALVDGGVVIDNSARRNVVVDPRAGLVHVDPGVLLGELDAATAAHGLAVPVGINTTTGLAGLALGGGIGWMMRRHGLTCDQLVGADVILADGTPVHATAEEEPELFWGLRGGGGNFGVVTKFTFRAARLHPDVRAGFVFFSLDEGESVLRRYRDWAAALPGSVTTIVALRTVLPVMPLPAELHGRRVVGIGYCEVDPGSAPGPSDLIASFGTVLASSVRLKPFRDHQAALDATVPAGHRYYWKSHFLDGLPDGAIEALVEHHRQTPTSWSYSLVPQLGGAIERVSNAETAYANRDAPFAVNINGVAEERMNDGEIVDWTRRCFDALSPFSTGGVYVNFMGNEGEERVRSAYGSAYDRLAQIKARYDPDNVFRVNQNIRPA